MPSIPRYQGPPRVAIYTRVSSPGQELDGTSLDTQRELSLAHCKTRGYQVIQVFTEVHTGSELYERKELSRLRELVRNSQIDVLLSYALDRLSRNQAHVYVVADECERHGARLEFVTEDFEDSAVGRFVRSAKAFAAEVEREKIMERAYRGMRARAMSGRIIPGPKPPYGYHWTADHGALVIDPATAPIVERIFQEATQGKSLRAIALGLTQDDILSPTAQTEWTHSTVRWILRLSTYAGHPMAFRRKQTRQQGRMIFSARPLEEQIALPPSPAIVSPAVFEFVQNRLRQNQAQASRNNPDPEAALLRGGYVRCGYCGRALGARNLLQDPSRSQYVCVARRGFRTIPCQESPTMQINKLDRLVWTKLSQVLLDPDVLPAEFARFTARDHPAQDTTELDRQLADVTRQQQRLVDNLALVDGEAATLIGVRLHELGSRQARLRAERETRLSEQAHWETLDQRMTELRDWCEITAQHLATMEYRERRAVLDWLGVQVTVWKFRDQPPEMTADLPQPTGSFGLNVQLVDNWAGRAIHNDGIRLRWRLE